jgi:hypothetical protein
VGADGANEVSIIRTVAVPVGFASFTTTVDKTNRILREIEETYGQGAVGRLYRRSRCCR